MRCLETNVFAFPSPREADLAASKRDTSVFDFLLQALKPRIVFVHGSAAIAHVAQGDAVPLGVFTPVQYNEAKFDLIAGHHLAYQWSFAKVDELAQRIQERYDTLAKNDA